MENILITGGAGFVGSSLALLLKKHNPALHVFVLDNLRRRGSELNLPRLKKSDIAFHHGDIRNKEDLDPFKSLTSLDLIIECSAEPSVLAGMNEAPEYVINTNLLGTINCLNLAHKHKAKFLFLSTSRVYPYQKINELSFQEEETRFQLKANGNVSGISQKGINEQFSLDGPRTFYGATKLCSEILIQEYVEQYSLKAIINRCGVITGPWQMGKVDQGFVVLWVAHHFFQEDLSYIGFNGNGKQVRDILDIEDLFHLIDYQIKHFDDLNGEIFNVGGGMECNVSLLELTKICQDIIGNQVKIQKQMENRLGDIPWYITDHSKVTAQTGLKPRKTVLEIIENIFSWIKENENSLKHILKS